MCTGGRETDIQMEIAALQPSEPTEFLSKFHKPRGGFRIAFSEAHQHADALHAIGLLRARRQRPRRRAAEQRDEGAAFHHSITSSAVICMISGTVRPSVLAVLRLMTSSNLVGCNTGKSDG